MAKKPKSQETPQAEAQPEKLENAPPGPRYSWPDSTEKRPLFVTLNTNELEASARKLATTVGDIGRLERDAKASAQQWKAKIETVKAQQEHLSCIVQEGREERPVECRWLFEAAGFDSASGEIVFHPEKKTLIRTDTNEVLEIRDITSDERQMSLLPDEPPQEEAPEDSPDTEKEPEPAAPPSDGSDLSFETP